MSNDLIRLNTSALLISFVSRIEEKSAAFYSQLALQHEVYALLFSSFVKENSVFDRNIKRAYYNVVSDALETGFCFNITVDERLIAPSTYPDIPSGAALQRCIELEDAMAVFYIEAARQSKVLLSDVSRAMDRVVRSRQERKRKLQQVMDTLSK
jgi:hypothetical protein